MDKKEFEKFKEYIRSIQEINKKPILIDDKIYQIKIDLLEL